MARNVIKAKLDIIFKKMFSEKENEDMLHDLLASMLSVPYESIKNIEVLNPDILPETVSGKFSRMDIKLQVDDKIINVEMQVKNEGDFRDRSLYYWSKLYSGELKSGEEYSQLKKSIAINIVNFKMFDCMEYHSEFTMLETTRHEQLSEKCAIHFFELKKIGKKVNKNDRMELWLQLINAESEEELDMIKETNIPVMEKAVMIIHQMSDDEKIQEIARLREKALHDEASALSNARREGKAEGLAEGRAEEQQTMIEAMRLSGLSEEVIKKILDNRR